MAPAFIPIPEQENTIAPETIADHDSRFQNVMDVELHYKQERSGEREIVLLYGFGASVFS